MRPEPGAQAAAAGPRASRADRDRVIDLLKAAFVQGRLDRDEFDARIGRALASRTCGELAAVTAGIPAGLTAALPRRPPARARRRIPFNTAVTGGAASGSTVRGVAPVARRICWRVMGFMSHLSLVSCHTRGTGFQPVVPINNTGWKPVPHAVTHDK